tara:strand:+ start:1778 stop:3295 length:1518 start_codon:yes stop_codon:yes gene_type:complete
MNNRLIPKIEKLPHALYTAKQLKYFDRQIFERFKISEDVMAERAGTAAFKLAYEKWPEVKTCHVFCGLGKNGEDGFVFALKAKAAGWNVCVSLVSSNDISKNEYGKYANEWISKNETNEDLKSLPYDCDLIIDSILGIGLSRVVDGSIKEAVEVINEHSAPTLSIDIPTGLDSDTGAILGVAVKADITITFVGLKQGMFSADGVDCCGSIFFDSIGIPAAIYASQILSCRRLSWHSQSSFLMPREKSSYKGNFGHLLVIGGDYGLGGAVRLAGEAALRTGAGLVSVATREENIAGLQATRPEIMAYGINAPEEISDLIQKADAVVIGPGLGLGNWGRRLVKYVLNRKNKIIIDADALKILPGLLADLTQKLNSFIYTPHLGEAEIMGAGSITDIYSNRFQAAETLQKKYSGCVVLKGPGTIISTSAKVPLAICSDGNPGMASGGMGDALAGIIGSFYAQNFSARDASELGVCLHSAAADQAAKSGEKGLLASDLMPYLKKLLNKL